MYNMFKIGNIPAPNVVQPHAREPAGSASDVAFLTELAAPEPTSRVGSIHLL
jgi:hypothetical protein